MPPLGSPFDDGSRKPRGAERPELKQSHRGTPADPQFPEAYRSEGKKKPLRLFFCKRRWFYSSSSTPSPRSCPSPPLYSRSARLCKELLSSILHGSLGMRRLTGVSLPVAQRWDAARKMLTVVLRLANKGAGQGRPAARRGVVTLCELSPGTPRPRGPADLPCKVTWGTRCTASRASVVQRRPPRPPTSSLPCCLPGLTLIPSGAMGAIHRVLTRSPSLSLRLSATPAPRPCTHLPPSLWNPQPCTLTCLCFPLSAVRGDGTPSSAEAAGAPSPK